MIEEAVAAELAFAPRPVRRRHAGMSVEQMRQYLEYVADQRLARLGLPARYGTRQPVRVHGAAGRAGAGQLLRAAGVGLPGGGRGQCDLRRDVLSTLVGYLRRRAGVADGATGSITCHLHAGRDPAWWSWSGGCSVESGPAEVGSRRVTWSSAAPGRRSRWRSSVTQPTCSTDARASARGAGVGAHDRAGARASPRSRRVTWLVIQASYALTDVVLDRLVLVEGERNRRARRILTQITLVRRVATAAVIVVALRRDAVHLPAGARARRRAARLRRHRRRRRRHRRPVRPSATCSPGCNSPSATRSAWTTWSWWRRSGAGSRSSRLTYVVVRLWDERRLVLPVSYFTHNPFENWTRHGSRVIGAVFLRRRLVGAGRRAARRALPGPARATRSGTRRTGPSRSPTCCRTGWWSCAR